MTPCGEILSERTRGEVWGEARDASQTGELEPGAWKGRRSARIMTGKTRLPAHCAQAAGNRRSGELLVDESGELGLAHRADLGRGQLAVLEQHQRGDAADAELGGDVAVLVHVHLGDLQLAFVGVGDLVEDGRD